MRKEEKPISENRILLKSFCVCGRLGFSRGVMNCLFQEFIQAGALDDLEFGLICYQQCFCVYKAFD